MRDGAQNARSIQTFGVGIEIFKGKNEEINWPGAIAGADTSFGYITLRLQHANSISVSSTINLLLLLLRKLSRSKAYITKMYLLHTIFTFESRGDLRSCITSRQPQFVRSPVAETSGRA